jgi:uncharacterized membrane protein YqhA
MRQTGEPPTGVNGPHAPPRPAPTAPFARAVGGTRFVVLLAVGAVLLVAIALFVLGTVLAVVTVGHAVGAALRGQLSSTDLTVEFLEIVSVLLKAVIFYIIGVGFYSLFVAPISLPVALGIESLNDLETKVVSVVIVIMAVTFLEHFILWERPGELLQHGVTLAAVVLALVAFQVYSHWAKEQARRQHLGEQREAQHQLFDEGRTQLDPRPGPADGGRPSDRA